MARTLHILFLLSYVLTMGCPGCGHTHDDHDDHGEHGHSHGGPQMVDPLASAAPSEEVHLLEKQMEVMNIQLGNFQYLDLSTTVKSSGQLRLPPQKNASVSSIVEGRIKTISVIDGDYVRKGQVLATIEQPDFIDLQQDYLEEKNELVFLEKEYKRAQQLLSDSVMSRKDFQEAESAFLAMKARVSGLRTKIVTLGLDPSAVERGELATAIAVRSPLSGYVQQVMVNIGRYVMPSEMLFEIIDNAHIHIDLLVYEKDLTRIRVDQKVMFSLTNQSDQVYEGRVFALGRSFDRETKAMVVHAEIENEIGNLLPGMYVDARIITETARVRSLPDEAIVSDGGLDYIFVLESGGNPGGSGALEAEKGPLVLADAGSTSDASPHGYEGAHGHSHGDEEHSHSHEGEFVFRKIEVNTGAKDIGFTEVVPAQDMDEDAQIVTAGAYYLMAEMKKGVGGHGHHH